MIEMRTRGGDGRRDGGEIKRWEGNEHALNRADKS
jgi:hypothetical protein